MFLNFKLSDATINKLKNTKVKNPSIILHLKDLNQNAKYSFYLTIGQYNKLLSDGKLKYVITDARRNRIIKEGSGLADILSLVKPLIKPILTKAVIPIGVGALSTGVNYGIRKSLDKKKNKKEGSALINISIDDKLKKSIEDLYYLLKKQKISLNQQEGSSIMSFLIPTAISLISDLLVKGKSIKKSNKINFQ